jgi:hypothetical protein
MIDLQAARDLDANYEQASSDGQPVVRLYSCREVARALGLVDELTGDECVALLEAYERGCSTNW